MKQKLRIVILMLGMLTLMPGICFSRGSLDSLVLQRIWDYRRNYTQDVGGVEQNVYMRYTFETKRRNPTLFLVPTMHVLAKGNRQFIGESYCKLKFRDIGDYDLHRQVVCGTIPRNRTAMPAMLEFMTPNLYGVSLYPQHLLSPFHQANKRFYHYRMSLTNEGSKVIIHFSPKANNTQLVTGHATANIETGRLLSVVFEGEFDMIAFKVTAVMDQHNQQAILPERCITTAKFKFLGNSISAAFSAIYNCPTTLPDSISEEDNRALMGQLRPIPLRKMENDIYMKYDEEHTDNDKDSIVIQSDSIHQEDTSNSIKEIAWNVVGDNLVNSIHGKAGPVSVHLSPLLNPLYLGYSHSRGLSYKINVGARYAWNTHRYMTLNPRLGYNFKQHQFYYTAPLRVTYNPKRNGYAQLTWANGNRISNSSLIETIEARGDTLPDYDFKDEYWEALNNVVAFDWMEITAGLIYHRRRAADRMAMRRVGMTDEYRSFAPFLTFRLTPWHDGPTLTANYERSFRHVLRSNLSYERWELDAAYKKHLSSLRVLNARLGTGFYSDKSSNYFVDYTNFRDNNLPQGWDDEWSGQFQLLDAQWYNESDYYVRGHISYESPLLCFTRLPYLGHFIETERVYLSSLAIDKTRLYSELGYSFTTRYLSVGLFSGFLGTHFHNIGCKFTVELFRRW